AFARARLAWDGARYTTHVSMTRWVFSDRGLPDIRGYCRVAGSGEPPGLAGYIARCRYHATVFLAPPWRAIYAQDAERKQDFGTAVATGEQMRAGYTECGYRTPRLPCCGAPARRQVALRGRRIAGGSA